MASYSVTIFILSGCLLTVTGFPSIGMIQTSLASAFSFKCNGRSASLKPELLNVYESCKSQSSVTKSDTPSSIGENGIPKKMTKELAEKFMPLAFVDSTVTAFNSCLQKHGVKVEPAPFLKNCTSYSPLFDCTKQSFFKICES